MSKKFHLPKAASIFTAKACAILEAFHHTQNNNTQTFIIFTDFMSVIRAIENINSKTKHETILNIQHIFTYLTNNNKDIIIAWVPSHQKIKGNEEADIAAKEPTSPSSDVKMNFLSRPYCNITLCRKTIMEQNMEHLQKNKNS